MTVLVSDSFNRANSTSGLGTTDSYNGGTAYTWSGVGNAVWGINSNQAYTPTPANDSPAFVNIGQSDQIQISADIQTSSGIYPMGIAFRIQNANNYFRAYASNTVIKIDRILNGSVTTILSQSISATAPFTLNVQLNGTTITAFVNSGTQYSVTDSNLQTQTNHGMYIGNSSSYHLDNFNISSLGTTGTNATVTSVIANAAASTFVPTVAAQQQVAVSGMVANTNANALAPSISTSSSVSALITSVVANANANALSPLVSLDNNIQSAVGSATATALTPQVGSYTNVSINAVVSTASAGANNPGVEADKSVNLGVPVSNAVGSLLVPNVGSSVSVQIASAIASIVVNGIAPSIATAQGINVNPNAASASASALSPTIQRDMVLFANVGNVRTVAIAPTVFIVGAPKIHKTTQLSGSRKLHENLNGSRKMHEQLGGYV